VPAWLRTLAIHAAAGLAWLGVTRLVDPFAAIVLPALACVLMAIVHVLRDGWGGLRWGAILSSWAIGCGLFFLATIVLVRGSAEVAFFCFAVALPLSLASSLAVVLAAPPPSDDSTESDQF